MRRVLVGVVLAGVTVGLAPGVAVAAPIPDPSQFVHSIDDPQQFVYDIVLDGSTQSLQSEKHNGDTTTVTINSDVLFAFDKAKLTANAKTTLKALVSKLRKATGTIKIDGYTDSKGSDSYNLKLSKKRAAAVQDYLSGQLPGAKLSADGHGEADPVASNEKDGKDNPQGRAKNRRVTIQY